ncbi:acryloyl-CoA reductase [Alteromonas sp. BL110]|uniref:YhdH/YhfP family quinone oxidoreductase n=1 Tax=Alteromonas sp. BL110 TaxID=1714845 RepID=UPI000E538C99|nr:YhdH/YhfP family quinone oxidoreductase [Alteromonas sp. BL110]AXT39935.1 acryloyl-CoA reductase [Alteromonas sp. BL110]RKM79164.1 acryloyl-CoA reductase [Alteromonas sp. BL110]
MTSFKALLVEKQEDKSFTRGVTERSLNDLPEGTLLIKVEYSSLNYKDALSATGNPGVSRNFPHTPGIDAAGTVVSCDNNSFKEGDEVIVTGYDLGMNTPGGFGEYIKIPSEWAVAKPDGLTLRESMVIGTAGFTAGLSVQGLVEHGVTPEKGDILVTGATGGVGSVAVALLANAGFSVVACTGKKEHESFLQTLGANKVITRDALLENKERPMLKEQYAGAVDTVGGEYLAQAIKATQYGGSVTCCGLTASADLDVSVFPFILRGVSLLGIDSVQCPMPPRLRLWDKLASEWKLNCLDDLTEEVSLDDVSQKIDAILKGELWGRTLVKL